MAKPGKGPHGSLSTIFPTTGFLVILKYHALCMRMHKYARNLRYGRDLVSGQEVIRPCSRVCAMVFKVVEYSHHYFEIKYTYLLDYKEVSVITLGLHVEHDQ